MPKCYKKNNFKFSQPSTSIMSSSSYSPFPSKGITIEINGQDSFITNNAAAAAAATTANATSKNDEINNFVMKDKAPVGSASSSSRRSSTLMRSKTKSRLLDPPEENKANHQTQRTSDQVVVDILEDDPFLEEDIPEEYKRITFSALSVMQLVSLISISVVLVCSLTINYLKKRSIFEMELWRWELTVMVLICGRLVSGWGVRFVVHLMERNFLWRKRVLYFVYGLKSAVQNCVWLALVLVAWQCIFDKKVQRLTHRKIIPRITKIWICLLVGTIIWLLKTLLVKVLASSFHVSTFFDRIQESLFNQYVIETLSGPEIELQPNKEAVPTIPADLKANLFTKTGRLIGNPRTNATSSLGTKHPKFSRVLPKKEQLKGITVDELHRLNQKNISAWNMKRLMSIVKKGALSTLQDKMRGSTGYDESVQEITSENEAKAASKKIFINVAKPGSRYIYEEDLMRFMRHDEVSKTMGFFKGATEREGISKQTLSNWMVNAFRERRALALSLNDTNTAVKKLHEMINCLVALILIIIWLLILKIATTSFFIFLSSQLILAAFMFGNTLKSSFEGIIFLFVMHPFDVGDRVEIDGVHMVVEEMNILTTVLLKFDNHKVYYPNNVLASKPIFNYYRSPDMRETIDFSTHISTPPEKIAIMKERLISYFNSMSEHWHPEPKLVMRDVDDTNRLKWSMWAYQTMNFHDMTERLERRSLLIEEMINIFRELNIEFRLLPLAVNVPNTPVNFDLLE